MADAKSKAYGAGQKALGSKEGRKFLDSLVNAQNRINTWRNISILLVVLIIFLLYSLVRMSQTLPVRLIPYEVATGNTELEVGPMGEGAKHYVAHIAEADLALYTTWRSDTVGRRFNALTKRMTPAMHTRRRPALVEEAEEFSRQRYYQMFFPSTVKSVGSEKVVIGGVLQRWSGNIEVLNEPISYTLTYKWFNGVPMLHRITAKGDNVRQRAQEGGDS